MPMGKSLMGRGIVSDRAKKLSDVIDRIAKADALAVSPKSWITACPKCGHTIHITEEKNLPDWNRFK